MSHRFGFMRGSELPRRAPARSRVHRLHFVMATVAAAALSAVPHSSRAADENGGKLSKLGAPTQQPARVPAKTQSSILQQAAAPMMAAPGAQPSDPYRLDRGDRLKLRFFDRFDRDDLNGEYVVGEGGQLRLPRIGAFDASDKTVAELEAAIREVVEGKGEKIGAFSIDISERRPFYVGGLANKPGSYPYVPGLTVLHAVSLAGGFFRATNVSPMDAAREKTRLSEAEERLKSVVARRARLVADRDGAAVAIPSELIELDPMRAGEIIDRERALLQRTREVEAREKVGNETIIAMVRNEVESYQAEIAAITQRMTEQNLLLAQMKEMHDRNVVGRQRYVETVTSYTGSQRDKQMAIGAMARAKVQLEKASREQSMAALLKQERIAKELTEAEAELARLRVGVEEMRRLVADLETSTAMRNANVLAVYRILRREGSDQYVPIAATERTPILPGDIIQIESLSLKRLSDQR